MPSTFTEGGTGLRDIADRLANRLIEIWHDTGDDETRSAHEFMDMTWDEYKAWVERSGIWGA